MEVMQRRCTAAYAWMGCWRYW